MESNYNNSCSVGVDNSVLFNVNYLSKLQWYYYSLLVVIMLLPFTWFIIMFIKFELFTYIAHCSGHGPGANAPSSDTAAPHMGAATRPVHGTATYQADTSEEIYNQQSNSNDQSYNIYYNQNVGLGGLSVNDSGN